MDSHGYAGHVPGWSNSVGSLESLDKRCALVVGIILHDRSPVRPIGHLRDQPQCHHSSLFLQAVAGRHRIFVFGNRDRTADSRKALAPRNAFRISFSIAIGFVITETLFGFSIFRAAKDRRAPTPSADWSGLVMVTDPRLGSYPAPNSSFKTYYAQNPRAYFTKENNLEGRWRLALFGSDDASLLFSSNQTGAAHFIRKADLNAPRWQIQLNQEELPESGITDTT